MQPYFQSMSEFLAMGNHGVYVWSCWGIVLTIVFGLIMYSQKQRKNVLQNIKHQHQRQKNRDKHQPKLNKDTKNNHSAKGKNISP